MIFFTYFTKIQGHWTEKFWGSLSPPLGAPSPLNYFWNFGIWGT